MRSDPGAALAEFEQLLVSNSGEDAFVVALQLLAAKLLDELAVREGASSRFVRDGDAQRTRARLVELHSEAMRRFSTVEALRAPFAVDADVLARCLPPLLGWSIL